MVQDEVLAAEPDFEKPRNQFCSVPVVERFILHPGHEFRGS